MTAAAVATEITEAVRAAGFLRARFQAAGDYTMGYVAADQLAEALINQAGGREDAFSLKAASEEMFAMDKQRRMEAVPDLPEEDPKSYLAASLAA